MPTDLAVQLEDRPGELARLGETLGGAGVNITGFCATTGNGRAEVHVMVEDEEAARKALESAGIIILNGREMLVASVEERPGELGRVSRAIGDAGVNIELAYPAERGLAFGVDDLEKARSAVT